MSDPVPAPALQNTENSAVTPLDTELPYDEVAKLAYSYFEERQGVGGSPEDDWLRAERELRARRMQVRTMSGSGGA